MACSVYFTIYFRLLPKSRR